MEAFCADIFKQKNSLS